MRPITPVSACLLASLFLSPFLTSCKVDYGSTAFRCDPSGGAPNCPEQGGKTWICCSDDASAMLIDDLNDVVLPDYAGHNGTDGAIPLFSGVNNILSTRGMCIGEGDVSGPGSLLEKPGCPIPCNPTWGSASIGDICGSNAICCQTAELGPNDCRLDNDCWRPVNGTDIGSDETWAKLAHDTHQRASACTNFALGAGGSDEVETACYDRLTVADQRGFCLGKSASVSFCPSNDPLYFDACELLNLDPGYAAEHGKPPGDPGCPLRPD